MAVNDPNKMTADQWAEQEYSHPSEDWTQRCQAFVSRAFGWKNDPASSAAEAWRNTPTAHKHPGEMVPPANVPVYWSGGSSGFGHVAISDGQGNVWSSDILRPGKVDNVPISYIEQRWGLTYEGWADQEAGTGRLTGNSGGGGFDPNPTHWPSELLNKVKGAGSSALDVALSPLSNLLEWIKSGTIRAAFFIMGTILIIFFVWKEAQG